MSLSQVLRVCVCLGGIALWTSRSGEEVWSSQEITFAKAITIVTSEPLIVVDGCAWVADPDAQWGLQGCIALPDVSNGDVIFKRYSGGCVTAVQYCDVQGNVFIWVFLQRMA